MTREEIKQKQAVDMSANAWMREICLQLALLNEKQDIEKRVPGRPPLQKVN